jgi:hypothetical protein
MKEAMSMLQVEEVAAAAASSLTRGYGTTTSTMIACTPVLSSPEVSCVEHSFPKHYT